MGINAKHKVLLEKATNIFYLAFISCVDLAFNKFCFLYLGTHKTRFIPTLVGPFLEMTLIPEEGKIC